MIRSKMLKINDVTPLYYDTLSKLIEDRNERNKDKRIEMLKQINSMLLKSQLSMPYQFTSEYVNLVLPTVEGELLLIVGSE
jgi:hypothetical protein